MALVVPTVELPPTRGVAFEAPVEWLLDVDVVHLPKVERREQVTPLVAGNLLLHFATVARREDGDLTASAEARMT